LVHAPVYPLDDDELKRLVLTVDKVGIDVPLGWPERFVQAIAAHQAFQPWPIPMGMESELFYRQTDRFVRQHTGLVPLSVCADRIAWPAVRASRLMSELASAGVQVDRSGLTGSIVEVYPAAALRTWLSQQYHYKGPKGADALKSLAGDLLKQDWLKFEAGSWDTCTQVEHCFDALVAALVAHAHTSGLCEDIAPEQVASARIEGWIALPRRETLKELGS